MAKHWSLRAIALAAVVSSQLAFTGCNSSLDNNPTVGAGHSDGVSQSPDTPSTIPPLGPPPSANTMTIALRYVALRPDSGTDPYPTQAEVQTALTSINNAWAQCDIRFQLEDYQSPLASDAGLNYYPANHSELDEARAEFDDNKAALIVKTGTWNRAGDLGYDGSNGFSTIPPASAEGVVVEKGVAVSALLLSHELGHLVGGLDHSSSSTNLMNHFVTPQTTGLSTSQCNEARSVMRQYHQGWIR